MSIYLYRKQNKQNKQYTYLHACYSVRKGNTNTRVTVKKYGREDLLLEKGVTLEDIKKDIERLDKEYRTAKEENNITNFNNEYVQVKRVKEEGDIDFNRVLNNLSLQHVPLRYMWELLEVDKIFQQVKYDCKRRSKTKANKELPVRERVKEITYDIDKVAFYLCASRICNPSSKLKTYTLRHNDVFDYSDDITLYNVYDCLSILNLYRNKIKVNLDKNVRNLFDRDVSICLFDVTTFYFDSDKTKERRKKATLPKLSDLDKQEDKEDLKKGLPGFGMSKDRKFGKTQVVMALVSDANGIPLTYKIFNGSTVETKTFLVMIQELIEEFNIDPKKLIVCADAGLNSLENIAALQKLKVNFIINYPPSNRLSKAEKQLVLFDESEKEIFLNSNSKEIFKESKLTKIYEDDQGNKIEIPLKSLTKFSKKRYKKDNRDIEKDFNKAEKNINKGLAYVSKVVKSSQASHYKIINEDNPKATKSEVTINENLFNNRKKLAGYANVVTQIEDISPQEAHKLYSRLYKIEENFRTYKTNLLSRPIYVFSDEHIEGHFLMCFISQVVLKCALYYLKERNINLTQEEFISSIQSYSFAVVPSFNPTDGNLFFNLTHNEPSRNNKGEHNKTQFCNILCALDPKIPINEFINLRFLTEHNIRKLFNLRMKPQNMSQTCLKGAKVI